MSTIALFVVGCGVTLLTVAAVGLLVYAAVLDGRIDAEQRASVLSANEPRDLSHAA